jgi:hypothetical protein
MFELKFQKWFDNFLDSNEFPMKFGRSELFKLIQFKFHRELRWSTAHVGQIPVASSLAHLTGPAKTQAWKPIENQGSAHGALGGDGRPNPVTTSGGESDLGHYGVEAT